MYLHPSNKTGFHDLLDLTPPQRDAIVAELNDQERDKQWQKANR